MAGCSGTAEVVREPTQPSPSTRTIHPTSGGNECVEMYGSCTEPPDQLCTSNALALQCGEHGQLPSTGEQLTCVCP
ncbi:MAG TPA: hypothetical protein VFN67_33090 [Polyangiales bacterium]|nr:hypothetical protein [Polyangiales bacterium]